MPAEAEPVLSLSGVTWSPQAGKHRAGPQWDMAPGKDSARPSTGSADVPPPPDSSTPNNGKGAELVAAGGSLLPC